MPGMKAIRSMVAGGSFILMILTSLAGTAVAADDIATLFQQGRTAYYNGNLELARQLLTQVQTMNPKHYETNALLAQINAQSKKGEASLQKQYEGVIIPKFTVTDATLQESLQVLVILAKKVTGDKVTPNFIVKSAALNSTPISLSLTNVPLTEAVRYLAEMARAKTTWDKHAVMFAGAAD